MDFYINELSLHGQFSNENDFIISLRNLYNMNSYLRNHSFAVYISLKLQNRQISNSMNFLQAISAYNDKNFKRVILNWLQKSGHFWESNPPIHNPDEYYEDNISGIITDFSLAQVAFKNEDGIDSSTVSFKPSKYNFTPIEVTHHLNSTKSSKINIENYWNLPQVKIAYPEVQPDSWEKWESQMKQHNTEVKYTENTFEPIKKFPFNSALMKKLSSLLSILNELSSCFDFLGGLNQRGLEIIKQYFQGEKADFSDESQTNKNKFQTGLTFDINGTQVFCPWHGKARAFNDQYRIHFTWPDRIEDDEGNKQIYIVYIGEKITKA